MAKSEEEKRENEKSLNEIVVNQTEISEEMASVNEEHVELEKEIERNKAEIIELLNAKSLIKTKIQRCDTYLNRLILESLSLIRN